jgi:DMSO/TMAO reductase YedYZ molybdopterin-dependent catalytic subunit
VLALAGPKSDARYVVFHCLDKINIDGNYYYESLDLFDALHPQTILAYGMNGKPLPIGHGAPL